MKKLELPTFLILHHPEIDGEHLRLVGYINDIVKAFDAGEPEDAIRLLDDFFVFAEHHFENEETILREAGYPELNSHADIHRSLRKKAPPLRQLGEKARGGGEEEKERFMVELTSYLLDDALKADVTFKSFLMEAGLCEPPS